MLTISCFSKQYNDYKILSIESVSLARGIHLIKGDNGSGKTTLFKCLSGISPCEGSVTIDRLSLKKDPLAYRYCVNFSEAEPIYPAFLTGRDLMRFVAKTKNASHEQENYYRQQLELDWFYNKPCGTYSSGMLKKLSLALAFLGDAKMIILDEPLITLDESTRGRLFELINERKQTIFLLSSHQPIEDRFLQLTSIFRIENKTLVRE